MLRVLILAYGNPLRSDDGLAWRAADALQARLRTPEVEILRLHQLAPELAETVSRAHFVIFVDAACPGGEPGEIRLREIRRGDAELVNGFSHIVSPAAVMSLAAKLYGASPRAFSATVTGHNFDHGESLSPAVAAALPVLVGRIELLLRPFLADAGKS
jgi:hydrogenase maturation protease